MLLNFVAAKILLKQSIPSINEMNTKYKKNIDFIHPYLLPRVAVLAYVQSQITEESQ